MITLARGMAVLMTAVLAHAPGPSLAQSVQAQSAGQKPIDELEEVVVVGRFPGPPLWKVSRGNHVLWILPLVDMYPKKMQWESARVEKLLASSQEYIHRPSVGNGFSVTNPLLIFTVAGLYSKSVYLPGKKTLADVLPPELYQRFRKLKSRHFPYDKGIERKNPGVAAQELRTAVLDDENLEQLFNYRFSPALITDKTNKILKGNKTIRNSGGYAGQMVKVGRRELKALGKVMEEISASPDFQRRQVACFEKIIDYFEKDLEPVKKRANAWARGRVDDLINPTPLYSVTSACADSISAVKDLPGLPAVLKLQKEFPEFAVMLTRDRNELMQQSRQRWLAAAEAALEMNASSFGMLNVNDVLDKDGLVEQLRAKGYTVEISAE
jgi:hypothetical protein